MRKRCIARAEMPTDSERFSALRRSLVLHQQPLKIVPAVLPPLLAAEGGREEGVKVLKVVVNPLETRPIHHPNHPLSS